MNTAALPAIQLQVTGMTCASCVRRVEQALAAAPGVHSASVSALTAASANTEA
jgi:Cu+-exporting ATPase